MRNRHDVGVETMVWSTAWASRRAVQRGGRRLRTAVALAALVAAGPTRAATLRVESAAVVFPDAAPGVGGSLTVSGLLLDFRVDLGANLRVVVGDTGRWIQLWQPSSDVVMTRSGGPPGTFSWSRTTRRLTIAESGALASRANPVAIELRQGTQVACTMIEFTEAGTQWTFGGGGRQSPCILRNAPTAEPSAIPLETPSEVRFRLPVGGLRPDGPVSLVRVDGQLAPVGAPVCVLRAEGAGMLGCTATLTETTPGPIRLRAEGRYGGARVASPSLVLDVPPASTTTEVPPVDAPPPPPT